MILIPLTIIAQDLLRIPVDTDLPMEHSAEDYYMAIGPLLPLMPQPEILGAEN
jgi:hypothetical protein